MYQLRPFFFQETPGEKSSVDIDQTDDLGVADDELLLDSHSEKREGSAKRLLFEAARKLVLRRQEGRYRD